MAKISVPLNALPAAAQAALANGAPSATLAAETPDASPASVIAQAGSNIVDAYRRYDALRVLTSLINGLPESAPFPAHVTVDEVTIAFRVNGVQHTVTTRTVRRIGDLYRLLAAETEALVFQMRDEALRAREAAQTVEEACRRSQYVANAQQAGQPG